MEGNGKKAKESLVVKGMQKGGECLQSEEEQESKGRTITVGRVKEKQMCDESMKKKEYQARIHINQGRPGVS